VSFVRVVKALLVLPMCADGVAVFAQRLAAAMDLWRERPAPAAAVPA
jgi:hypothetical protein